MPLFVSDIKSEMKQFPRTVKQYPRLKIKSLEEVFMVGVKSLLYKSVIEGETDDYLTTVRFFNIEINETKTKQFTEIVKVGDKIKYFKSPGVRSNPVMLKCSCPDFRFRWEKPLFDNKGLIGNWRKYERKTPPPPIGWPYANPDDLVGFCKHIWSLLNALRDSGRVGG